MIADLLQGIINSKESIRQAINLKGGNIPQSAKLNTFASAIQSLPNGGEPSAGFDFTQAKALEYLFRDSTRTSIDLTGINSQNIVDMAYVFYNCLNLTSVNIEILNTQNVTSFRSFLYNCKSLSSVNLSNLNTSKCTNTAYMFYNCSNLTTIDLRSCDFSKVTTITNMFSGCSKVTTLYLGSNLKCNFSISGMPLTHDSLINVLNTLPNASNTITLGSANENKLTTQEIAIATSKGWTIA